jgi:hypothetical protein
MRCYKHKRLGLLRTGQAALTLAAKATRISHFARAGPNYAERRLTSLDP